MEYRHRNSVNPTGVHVKDNAEYIYIFVLSSCWKVQVSRINVALRTWRVKCLGSKQLY